MKNEKLNIGLNKIDSVSTSPATLRDWSEEQTDIKEIINIKLLQLMSDLENKITNGRIKDKEVEKIKLDYFKTYLETIKTYSRLSKHTNTKYSKEDALNILSNEKDI